MADKKFTFWIAVCFTLNYIIGTGFLTIPWAFHQAGYLLGLALMGGMTVFALFAVLFILEAMSRAQELESVNPANVRLNFELNSFRGYNSMIEYNEIEASDQHHTIRNKRSNRDRESLSSGFNDENGLLVGDLKFETTELCQIFLGSTGKALYTIVISIYLYTTLWVYSTVFGQTFAAHADIGIHSYSIYIVLFGFTVIPISLMELSEQIFVQVILSACRIIMMVLMLGTVCYAKYHNEYPSFGTFYPAIDHPQSDIFNPSGIYLLLPIVAYANIFHQAIPDLSFPVHDKSQLLNIFSTSLIISVFAYSFLGVTLASYFGDKTNVASNLNWIRYHGHILADGSTPLYAKLISYFVVLFPAFDVASAFPLNAITLGNSLMSALSSTPQWSDMSREKRHTFRLLAAVPPVIAAFIVSNLGFITNFAGVTGFATAFIFPALLAYYSRRAMEARGLNPKTAYSVEGVGGLSQFCTILLGLGLTCFVIGSLIITHS